MKGILLAGGKGTRLYPATLALCKQLLPVYDKPMVYYPLSTLMLAGIRDILIISTPEDLPRFEKLFGTGESLGLSLQYLAQEKPEGIAQAILLAEDFLQGSKVALILGDNIFYGHHLAKTLQRAAKLVEGAVVFGYPVQNPGRYGVIAFDENQVATQILEKPQNPPSNFAVCGLYFYDEKAVSLAKTLRPSLRGELEITDLNQKYLEKQKLQVELLGRGCAWLDTGTFSSLQKASTFVETLQERQGFKIACIEEIAYRMGYISWKELQKLAEFYGEAEYGKYLQKLAEELKSSPKKEFSGSALEF